MARDVTIPSREKRDVAAADRQREVSSWRGDRHGGVTSPRAGRRSVTTEKVTRTGVTPIRCEPITRTSAELIPVKENSVVVANTSAGEHGKETRRLPTLVPKEKKEEDNQERRNTRLPGPVVTAGPSTGSRDPVSPLRSPTPVRRLSKVRAKVAQFEQLGGGKESTAAAYSPPAVTVPATAANSAEETTSSQVGARWWGEAGGLYGWIRNYRAFASRLDTSLSRNKTVTMEAANSGMSAVRSNAKTW